MGLSCARSSPNLTWFLSPCSYQILLSWLFWFSSPGRTSPGTPRMYFSGWFFFLSSVALELVLKQLTLYLLVRFWCCQLQRFGHLHSTAYEFCLYLLALSELFFNVRYTNNFPIEHLFVMCYTFGIFKMCFRFHLATNLWVNDTNENVSQLLTET